MDIAISREQIKHSVQENPWHLANKVLYDLCEIHFEHDTAEKVLAKTLLIGLFWLHRTKINKDGLVPLIVRSSFQNKKVEKASGYYVNPLHWNIQKQRCLSIPNNCYNYERIKCIALLSFNRGFHFLL